MASSTFPANLDTLDLIGKHILEVAQTAGIPKKKAYKLRLAVDELATNIINYGYADAPENREITIKSEVNGDNLKVTMIDTGKSYDPRDRQFDESVLSLPAEERAIGGLGIFLALQSVDEFTYETVEGNNISSLVINLDPLP